MQLAIIVININFGLISYRFRDIDAFSSKIARFLAPPLCDAPSAGTPCDIKEIYTPLKSTFSMRYNSVADNTGLYSNSFSRCWSPNLRNRAKFREIRTYSTDYSIVKVIQGHRSWCQSNAHIRLPISR